MQAMSSLDLGIDAARRFKYNHDSKLAELITFSPSMPQGAPTPARDPFYHTIFLSVVRT